MIYYRVSDVNFDSATTAAIQFTFTFWIGSSSVSNQYNATSIAQKDCSDLMVNAALGALVSFINTTYSTSYTTDDLVRFK